MEEEKKDNAGFSHYLCTWNNPPTDYWLTICAAGVDYCAGQEEIGENGTHHIQFYCWYEKGRKFRHVKALLPKCHLVGKPAPAAEDCWIYCKKADSAVPGTWKEWGRKPQFKKKKSQKYDDSLQSCKNGKWEDADPEHQVKYHGNLTKLTAHYTKPVERDGTCGHWISGQPGTGKSFVARNQWLDAVYDKPQNKWWDNYRGQPTVLIDDFDKGGICLSHHLKLWADRYGCTGEIKGGTVQLAHKRLVITSNYRIRELWPDDPVLCEALERRFEQSTVIGDYPAFELRPADEYMNSIVNLISN